MFGFIKRVDEVIWPEVSSVSPSSERIRSDVGLTLETSAFKSLYGGQITNICYIYHTLTLWVQGSPLAMTGVI